MNPKDSIDRADVTVWLPLLHILGGVAERVSRPRPDELREQAQEATRRDPVESEGVA